MTINPGTMGFFFGGQLHIYPAGYARVLKGAVQKDDLVFLADVGRFISVNLGGGTFPPEGKPEGIGKWLCILRKVPVVEDTDKQAEQPEAAADPADDVDTFEKLLSSIESKDWANAKRYALRMVFLVYLNTSFAGGPIEDDTELVYEAVGVWAGLEDGNEGGREFATEYAKTMRTHLKEP